MNRRSRLAGALLVGGILTALIGGPATAAAAPRQVAHPQRSIPGRLVEYRAGIQNGLTTRVGATTAARTLAAPRSTWRIVYKGDGWTPAARTVMRSSADYWASQLASSVPITVRVTFKNLGGSTLGYAGPTVMVENWDAGRRPVPDTFYPVALANAMSGVDQNGSGPEIEAVFDSGMRWYMGTDNVVPADRISFRGTVLHELGHGVGIIGSAWIAGGRATIGDPAFTGSDHPWILDRFVEAGAQPGSAILGMGPAALRSALVGGKLWFEGAATTGPRARLYAPATWQPGSSYSHLDEAAYPRGTLDSLMTPIGDYGEGNATAGPLTLRMLQDMGWDPAPPTACTRPADLDGDGFNDVVGINADGALVLAPGTDTGRLLSRRVLATGFGRYRHLVVGDWTGDGCADLLAYAVASRRLVLIPVAPGGGLGEPIPLVDFGVGGTWSVTGLAAMGDLDGDGRPDLLVRTNQSSPAATRGQLWLIRGDGAGGIQPSGVVRRGTGWDRYTEFFSAGDWNGDGRGDLLVRAPEAQGTLRMFRGKLDGTLGRPQDKGVGWNVYDQLFGSPDLTGDGLPEVVGRSASSGELVVERADATGGFKRGTPVISSGWRTFPVID